MAEKAPRRIALIGTINRDTIRTPDGVETESYGGLLYSALPLSAIVEDEAIIYPIVNVGSDLKEVVDGYLADRTNVSFEAIQAVPEKNTHCFLEYDEKGNKQETLLGGVPALTPERFRPYLTCDAICFNFITGLELELETMRRVRAETEALIFMDIHSLTLGMDDQRRRFWRIPPQWEEWTACADVVQMNEAEAALLAGKPLQSDSDTLAFARKLLDNGSSIVMVTRGAEGADVVFRGSTGDPAFHRSPASLVGESTDETGCGDVFLMGFVWSFLGTCDPIVASQFANTLAGINVTLRGIDGVRQIGDVLRARAAS